MLCSMSLGLEAQNLHLSGPASAQPVRKLSKVLSVSRRLLDQRSDVSYLDTCFYSEQVGVIRTGVIIF